MIQKTIEMIGLMTIGYFLMCFILCVGEMLWTRLTDKPDKEEAPYHSRHPF